jgi:hypothetical protein
MIAKDGRMLNGYYCAKNSSAEVKTIVETGIKKGVCSLKRVDHAGRMGRKQPGRKRR